MSKRDAHEEGKHEGGSERWLITYADMITLLLALFIMMYAMSSVDADKYAELSKMLNQTLNPSTQVGTGTGTGNGTGTGMGTGGFLEGTLIGISGQTDQALASVGLNTKTINVNDLQKELNNLINTSGLNAYASVHKEDRGITLSLVEGMLFQSGSADINPSANEVLSQLIVIIRSVDNYIRVEGSTDNIPIRTAKFPSNWELASQRAINVAKMLVSEGVDPSRISVVSYGEYRPVAPNDTEENRKLNRRVDIVFLNQALDKYEAGNEGSTETSD